MLVFNIVIKYWYIEYNIFWILSQNYHEEGMRLSFRRISTRPSNIEFDQINWIEISIQSKSIKKIAKKSTLLINVDESSLNRGMKIKYFWGLKGHPLEIQNSSFTGSVNIIMAICSNRAWINYVINETTDSAIF